MKRSIFKSVKKFARCTSAAAAVEFAVIAFPMVVSVFGFIEITQLIQADRRAEKTAASISDVVARDSRVSDTEIDDVFSMLKSLAYPASPEGLGVRVSSVQLSDNTVLWSEATGMSDRGDDSTASIPAGACSGETAILGESQYTYTPIVGIVFGFNPIVLTANQISCPRVIDPIVRIP